MLELQWTYSNSHRLIKWYGHVNYYGNYVIGQWFVLDAETGREYWSRKFYRPTSICDCTNDVIVAYETRSDGPWTACFGIYGINAKTGRLLWTNHARGLWGKLLRCFDYVPGFTNEFRDSPRCIVNGHVITASGRCLEVRTGRQITTDQKTVPESINPTEPSRKLYDNKSLETNGDTIRIEGPRDDFNIIRIDRNGNEKWRFAAKEHSLHVDGNYYSYRLHNDHIFMILGDAPNYIPIKASDPLYVKANPANYKIGVLKIETGAFQSYPLVNAEQKTECRIETIRDNRILVSCDGIHLAEYKIST
jgi:hypothetical protein